MRNLFSSAILLLVGLILAAAASAANPVYKWKDSRGHSHYSQSPPQDQKYQTIMPTGVSTDSSATAPPAAMAVAKASDDASMAGLTPALVMRKKNCDTARANISTLNAHASVTSDINGDGKAVTLNVAQHNAALAEAGKQVDLYCAQ